MTKAEVVSQVSEQTGIQKSDVLNTMEAFIKVMKNSMIEGKNIYIRGFGSFIIKRRAPKIARNISQNTPLQLPEYFIPAFKPAKEFVQKVKSSPKAKKRSGHS